MRQTKHPTHVPISIEYGSKHCVARYYVEKGMVTLVSDWGTRSAVIHSSPPDLLAEIMLREVLDAAKGRDDL
jgi:hypothetical protein